MSHIITIPVTVNAYELARLHKMRAAADLDRVSDHVLVQIIFLAGIDAERADLERLAEPEAA